MVGTRSSASTKSTPGPRPVEGICGAWRVAPVSFGSASCGVRSVNQQSSPPSTAHRCGRSASSMPHRSHLPAPTPFRQAVLRVYAYTNSMRKTAHWEPKRRMGCGGLLSDVRVGEAPAAAVRQQRASRGGIETYRRRETCCGFCSTSTGGGAARPGYMCRKNGGTAARRSRRRPPAPDAASSRGFTPN